MAFPPNAQIDQAADTLCRMAEIPGFDRGRAIFKGPGLSPVEWYSLEWDEESFADVVDVEVPVPSPSAYDDRGDLLQRCHRDITDGVYARNTGVGRKLPFFFEKAKELPREEDPDLLREMAGTLADEVEEREWRDRINAEWPPLAVVGGAH